MRGLKLTERYFPSHYVSMVEKPEFGIQVYSDSKTLCAIGYSGKSLKPNFHIKYRTLESMTESINVWVNKIIEFAERKISEKQKRAELQKNLVAADHYKIGDILYNSWGWEQTNIEFYQVTEVLKKKIRVARISKYLTDEKIGGYDSGKVMPNKDTFLEDEKGYLLSLKCSLNGDVHISAPESYYSFHKWEGKSVYCSWYA